MTDVDSDIKLPNTPIKQFQIECNAPLNAIVARVVKEPSWADVTLDSSFMSADGASPQKMDMATPPRIFAPIPRAHETAVAERQRTQARMQEKQTRLNNFIQQTKTRVLASEDSIRAVARAETQIVQEETRRRLDQGSSLIPRPTSAASRRQDAGFQGSKGAKRGPGVKNARDVAAELGSDVFDELSEAMMARRSLVTGKGGAQPLNVGTTPTKAQHAANIAAGASPMKGGAAVQEAVRDLRKTLVAAGKGEVWEGEQKQEMRERRTREVVYSEMRKSLMEGERMRVREARREREEAAARERREQEGRRRKDDQERISIEAEERLEALRQQTVLRSLAARLQAEKNLEEALNRPKRQQMENQRYYEALRFKILNELKSKGVTPSAFCPCVPPRSVADNRLHLCAHNCPLRGNWKTYHMLVSCSEKQVFGGAD